MIKVAVIGGGLSGTLTAMRLLEHIGERVSVTLVERKTRQLQRGVAYSARLSQQLLNVPAGNMSLFAEKPNDFLEWLHAGPMPAAVPSDLVSRNLFGDYVSDRFHATIEQNPRRLSVLHGEVVGLDQHPAHGYRLRFDDDRIITADVVVLALGNAPPAHIKGLDPNARKHPAYIPWPWQEGVLGRIQPDDDVVFIGMGLTMVDLLFSLKDAGHRGAITVLSRSGRVSLPHALGHVWTLRQPLPSAPYAVADLLRWVRTEARSAQEAGVPWQAVMDAVKPHVQDWWMGMPLEERQRFLRNARPLWEIHRHRMPTQVHQRLQQAMASGSVRNLAARVAKITVDDDRLRIACRERGSGKAIDVWAKHLINCTGPQTDARRLDQPLLVDMLAMGFVSWDPLHMGIRTEPSGALVDASGRASENLFAIGPLCKPTLWECTAVPEIRRQANALAELIAVRRPQLQSKGWRQVLAQLTDRFAFIDA
ncbi:MAG: FAD/NAD(P)-binding protein [Flavobacteriales bacterium]|nr:FAD/NAD(P)-binding protein [Flavobacteriales bacterium]